MNRSWPRPCSRNASRSRRLFASALAAALFAPAAAMAAPGSAGGPPEPGEVAPLPASDAAPAAATGGTGTTVGTDDATTFVPHEVIVRFDGDVGRSERSSALAALDADVAERLPIEGARLLELPSGVAPREAAAALERQPGVRYAQPNYLRQAEALPNDPRMRDLWGLHNTGQTVNGVGGTADADIDAPEAWNLTTGSPNVTVAVVDTGMAYDHPALQGNIWANNDPVGGGDNDANGYVDDVRGWDFVDDDNNPMEAGESHGTHVSGTIGARGNDGNSIVGVNWNVKLMPLRVLGPNGGSDADIASAFVYAARNGARVVNASLGGGGTTPLVQEAVRTNPNTLYVVAAGNGGSDGVGDNNDTQNFYPCNIPYANLICVAATDSNDQLTEFSNYGTTNVDLAAPGNNILSSVPAYRTPLFSDFQDDSYSNFDPGGWGNSGLSNGQQWSGYDGETADFGVGWSITDSAGLCWPGLDTTGCYATNVNHTAFSPVFSLAGMHDCTLSYWLWVDINAAAGFASERLSVIGVSDTTAASTIHNWNGGPGSPTTNPYTDDFSSFEGETGVQVQLNMRSDGSYDQRDGAHVDDVTVSCRSSNYGPGDFDYYPGTSMATPHVAGVAALLLARNPSLTTSQMRNALLNTGDSKPDLATATATGRRLNAAKAVASVTPPPPASKISIADARGKEGTQTRRNPTKNKLVFTVSRTSPSKPASVNYRTVAGSATQPADYTAKSGTLSFAAGQTTAKIIVPLTGDKKREPNEKFTVQLAQAKGAVLLDPKAIGTILNDD